MTQSGHARSIGAGADSAALLRAALATDLARTGRLRFAADVPLALTNVCFEGKNGHDANGPSCLLMTQSGHVRSGNVRQRVGRTACQSGVRTGTTANAV